MQQWMLWSIRAGFSTRILIGADARHTMTWSDMGLWTTVGFLNTAKEKLFINRVFSYYESVNDFTSTPVKWVSFAKP